MPGESEESITPTRYDNFDDLDCAVSAMRQDVRTSQLWVRWRGMSYDPIFILFMAITIPAASHMQGHIRNKLNIQASQQYPLKGRLLSPCTQKASAIYGNSGSKCVLFIPAPNNKDANIIPRLIVADISMKYDTPNVVMRQMPITMQMCFTNVFHDDISLQEI